MVTTCQMIITWFVTFFIGPSLLEIVYINLHCILLLFRWLGWLLFGTPVQPVAGTVAMAGDDIDDFSAICIEFGDTCVDFEWNRRLVPRIDVESLRMFLFWMEKPYQPLLYGLIKALKCFLTSKYWSRTETSWRLIGRQLRRIPNNRSTEQKVPTEKAYE